MSSGLAGPIVNVASLWSTTAPLTASVTFTRQLELAVLGTFQGNTPVPVGNAETMRIQLVPPLVE